MARGVAAERLQHHSDARPSELEDPPPEEWPRHEAWRRSGRTMTRGRRSQRNGCRKSHCGTRRGDGAPAGQSQRAPSGAGGEVARRKIATCGRRSRRSGRRRSGCGPRRGSGAAAARSRRAATGAGRAAVGGSLAAGGGKRRRREPWPHEERPRWRCKAADEAADKTTTGVADETVDEAGAAEVEMRCYLPIYPLLLYSYAKYVLHGTVL